MADSTHALREQLRRWTLILGVTEVTVGCLVGLVPPTGVPWFRGLVMAHIEYTANGVLMVVLGLLLREMRLGRRALLTWFAALQLGSWLNGSSALLAAVLGRSSPFLSSANASAPPPGGAMDPVVSGMLVVTALSILLALLFTVAGLWRSRTEGAQA